MQKVKDIKIGTDDEDKEGSLEKRSRFKAALSQTLWFLSTTRNIFVVLVCAALAYYFDTKNQQPFVLTGEQHHTTPTMMAVVIPVDQKYLPDTF